MSRKFRPAIRIGSKISANANDWLDRRSEETGLTKSALINMAIENYMQQIEVVENMNVMGTILEKLDALDRKVGE